MDLAPLKAAPPTAEQALEMCLQLNIKDQKWLLDQLALRLQNNRKKDSRDLDMWTTAVHQSMGKQMTSNGYGLLLIKKLLAERAHWEPIEQFMQSSGFSDYKVAERQAVYMLLADLVVAETLRLCRVKCIAPSLKMVANVAVNVGACFEDQFPGYMASGLAGVVVAQFKARQR